MQATVRSYDPSTGAGTVLLDDGYELPFPGEATRGSGVRSLRSGQRVQVQLSTDVVRPHGGGPNSKRPAPGTYVTALTVYTLPEAGYLTDS